MSKEEIILHMIWGGFEVSPKNLYELDLEKSPSFYGCSTEEFFKIRKKIQNKFFINLSDINKHTKIIEIIKLTKERYNSKLTK